MWSWTAGKLDELFLLIGLAWYLYVASQAGNTALTYAVFKGNLRVLKALLVAGADVEAKDQVGHHGGRCLPTKGPFSWYLLWLLVIT